MSTIMVNQIKLMTSCVSNRKCNIIRIQMQNVKSNIHLVYFLMYRKCILAYCITSAHNIIPIYTIKTRLKYIYMCAYIYVGMFRID